MHGLIALVPSFVPSSDSTGVNYMTALVLDAREAHSEGDGPAHGTDTDRCNDVTSEHHPVLTFLAAQTSQCLDAGCTSPGGGLCRCEEDVLAGKHISFEFSPGRPALEAQQLGNELPRASLPDNVAEAGNFAYVPNLAQRPFMLALNSDFLAASPSKELRETLLARMEAPFTQVTACSLATRQDEGEDYVHALGFRELHHSSKPGEVSQAVAQKVVLEFLLPEEATSISLVITDFADPQNKKTIPLRRRLNSSYKIDFSNHPLKPLELDDPCNDGVARHFAMYSKLAKAAPNPLLPHVKLTQARRKKEIGEPEVCNDPIFGILDRPICPMAVFNP